MPGAGGMRGFICNPVSQRLPPAGARTGSPPLPQNQLRDLSRVPAVPPDSPEGKKRPNPSGQGLSHTEFHPDFKPANAQPQRPGIAFEVKPRSLRSPAANQLVKTFGEEEEHLSAAC